MDVVTQGQLYQRMLIEGFDAEALLGVVKDTRFEQRLLTGGQFQACVQRIDFGEFSLDCGQYSLPVFASGSFGQKVVALAVALECAEPMWANGRQVACGRLMVFAENQELDVRPAPGRWCWCVLLIPRERLQAEAWYRHGRELALPMRGWHMLEHAPGPSAYLAEHIESALFQAAGTDGAFLGERAATIGQTLLGAYVDVLMAGLPHRYRRTSTPTMPLRHSMLIRRAEAYLYEHAGSDFSVATLSAAVGVGERQMERIFRNAYGMGPCRWHHVARLNEARRLLRAAPTTAHVTDIAGRLGFGHLGRFSGEYRQLFGESPRETLASRVRQPEYANRKGG
jgi:AraC-like DNA-binding protein